MWILVKNSVENAMRIREWIGRYEGAALDTSGVGGVCGTFVPPKRTSRESIRGSLSNDSLDLPIIGLIGGGWAVYTPDGGKLLEESGETPGENRLIGSRFFVRDYSDSIVLRWRQYDLRTGEQGDSCDYDMNGYIGSDGTVAVFEDGNPNVGLVTKAMDLATCDTLWTLTSPVGSFRDVWRVNTTLVQLSDDGTELFSLVAPT